jgi:hypothetical protein
MVATKTAEFYKYGPAQAFGADMKLPQGQKLTMLERQYGYSRVMLDDGTNGYVATEDLKLAPPEPPPPKPPKPSGIGSWFSGKPKNSDVEGTPSEPLFDVNDVPLPMPESNTPAAAEKPKNETGGGEPQPAFR